MKKKRVSFLLIFLAIFFILFLTFKLLSGSEKFQKAIITPLFKKIISLSHCIDNLKIAFLDKKNLLEINKNLQRQINNLIVENSKLKIYREENRILKEGLNFLKKQNYDFIVANVIGQIKEVPGNQTGLVLDVGEKEGVKVDYPVIFSESMSVNNNKQEPSGFLIGKIIKVSPHSSFVRLITNHQSFFSATILNEKGKINCLAQGIHELSLSLKLIPINKEVKKGDLVVTSGMEKYIPKGLIIGKVESIKVKSGKLFQDVLATPLISFNEINLLMVLKPKNEVK